MRDGVQPSAQDLALLSGTERLAYRLADFVARRLRWASIAWNSTVLVGVTWILIWRRVRIHGIDHVHDLDPARSTIMVANHRSFFDYFAVESALFRRTRLSRRVLFPVRADFFYETMLGVIINALLAGMTMFPPILRNPTKRAFNRHTLRRVAAELEDPRTVIGLHPEGTRNRCADPYDVRPGKLGIGEIILASSSPQVVPVFIVGLSNDIGGELLRNWRAPAEYPIELCFGPPIDLSDLRRSAPDRRAQRQAVDRCTAAIRSLAAEHRERTATFHTERAERSQAHR